MFLNVVNSLSEKKFTYLLTYLLTLEDENN